MPIQSVSQALGNEIGGSPFGFKNRVINGAMVIDQRNSGSSVTANTSASPYSPDRWNGRVQQSSGAFTMQQSTTAPSNFINSLLLTVTNTTGPAAGNRVHVRQIIEGNNIADLGWGTTAAKTVTLSFWVRSSITGLYGVGLINQPENRSYVGTYTINSSNTWEYKTITVPGDTTGTWQTNNLEGIRLTFDFGSGTSYNATTAETWVAQEACRTSSCVNWQQNSGATFYITGVQLEKGRQATEFDYRSYNSELQLCQRYFWKTYNISDVPGTVTLNGALVAISTPSSSVAQPVSVSLPVSMRTTPSVSAFGVTNGTSGKNTVNGNTATGGNEYSIINAYASTNIVMVNMNNNSINGNYVMCHLTASAEL
jgi:hypothetical protein